MFALLPFAGLVAGLIAIPVGLMALRIRRHTFVVVTIAIFFIFQLAAFNLGFTGGTSGITFPFAPFSAANYNLPFYYVTLIILVLTVIVSWSIRRSRFGLQLLAIRDDEDRALGLGVKTRRVKLTAFVISAIPIGMVGGLYFYFVGQVYPAVRLRSPVRCRAGADGVPRRDGHDRGPAARGRWCWNRCSST